MKKYRKKPVIVEAVRYLPTQENYKKHGQEIITWSGDTIIEYLDMDNLKNSSFWLNTHSNHRMACYGDWIVKDVDGFFYPCKPDIFEATYEEVTP